VNGIEALRRIRAHSQVPVLMLTARGDDVDRIVGLELGADDYVPKPCTPARAGGPAAGDPAPQRRACRRRGRRPAERRRAGDVAADAPRPVAGQPLALTSTEFNLLELLARNAGRVVGKPELSEQGWGGRWPASTAASTCTCRASATSWARARTAVRGSRRCAGRAI
jgi:DNA-binding response OmpR family regulator